MGSVGPGLKILNLQVLQNLDIESKGVFTKEEAMRVFKLFEAPIKVTTLKRKYFLESFLGIITSLTQKCIICKNIIKQPKLSGNKGDELLTCWLQG